MRWIMSDPCRQKFDIITDAIDLIDRAFDVVQCQMLIDDYVETCNPPKINKIFLECKLWNMEKSLE